MSKEKDQPKQSQKTEQKPTQSEKDNRPIETQEAFRDLKHKKQNG